MSIFISWIDERKQKTKKEPFHFSVGGEINALSSLRGKISKCTTSLPFPFLLLCLSLSFLSLLAILEVQKQSGWEGRGGSCWNTLEVEATVSQTPDILLRKSTNGHGYTKQNIQGARNQLTRHAVNMKRE